jgi:F-type H+-transporting ATPase subunit b
MFLLLAGALGAAGAIGAHAPGFAPVLAQAEAGGGGLSLDLFWIVLSSGNFVLLLVLLYQFAFKPLNKILDERRQRIEQGLKDAEEAHQQRERAAEEHRKELNEARREAAEIIARAQKVADESAAQLVATARAESDRIVERGRSEVEAEKDRAIAEIRAEVADLAIRAAGKVVGESLDGKRQRALVEQFLSEAAAQDEAQNAAAAETAETAPRR